MGADRRRDIEERMTTDAKESESTALVIREPEATGSISAFASTANYETARRMAIALSNSTIVPEPYRGERGIANCLIALELAGRTGASVMMVMQNLHVIQGKPSWSAAFLIASVNSCGRFTPIRYEIEGEPSAKGWRCRAYATDKATGDRLDGEWITWEMVTAEGWLGKTGSKWKTMPGQMIRYRAASFWTRTYAPEISLGMHTSDEMDDITPRGEPTSGAKALTEALAEVVAVEESEAPAINGTDIPCPDCDAKPFEPHKSECPFA
jgi:hypothetical protein